MKIWTSFSQTDKIAHHDDGSDVRLQCVTLEDTKGCPYRGTFLPVDPYSVPQAKHLDSITVHQYGNTHDCDVELKHCHVYEVHSFEDINKWLFTTDEVVYQVCEKEEMNHATNK